MLFNPAAGLRPAVDIPPVASSEEFSMALRATKPAVIALRCQYPKLICIPVFLFIVGRNRLAGAPLRSTLVCREGN
jgi:hypothetical protein